MKSNHDVRTAMFANGLRQWELARALNIQEETLSRKLRVELSADEKEKIMKVIESESKVANYDN